MLFTGNIKIINKVALSWVNINGTLYKFEWGV